VLRAQSKAESRKPEAVAWERKKGHEINAALNAATAHCNPPPVGTHDFLMRLTSQGSVTEVLMDKDTPFSVCIGTALKGLMLGNAPWDGYVLEMIFIVNE
jgi:hypothetical protein